MKINLQKLSAEANARSWLTTPPPIPFVPTNKKLRNDHGQKGNDEDDSSKYVSFNCRLDPKDKNSENVTRSLKVFENGTPEEYCKWRIDYDELVTYPAYNKADTKLTILLSILKGDSRDNFVMYHGTFKDNNDSATTKPEVKLSADELLSYALNSLARDVFKVTGAERVQKRY
jgi:hypothetical protein